MPSWFAVSLAIAAIGAGVGGVAVYAVYRRDIAAEHARVGSGSMLAHTAAGPIEYASEGEGMPVLVSHGAGGGWDQGLAIGRENLAPGFRLIAPSRFGYLRTPLPEDGSPAAQADAHAALLDHLGLEKVVVLGFSAGARSAVELALRHPDRVSALILESPITYAPENAPSMDHAASTRALLQLISAGADFAYWAAIHVARPQLVRFCGVSPDLEAAASGAERERVTTVIRGMLPISRRMAGVRNDAEPPFTPWPLDKIAAPTLVIVTADDLMNTLPGARFTAEHIAGAKLMVLDSGGHLVVNRTAEIRSGVAGFLAKLGLPSQAQQKSQPAASSQLQ